ncbi:site-2 protease family protein [Allobranchiibius sp. CTAmp26]|uniref:site-2 protease family protein n=1 Tax=Allobranchiibius sp. CTAmp26 TaxID=2815214 RepID=UPI001AA12497|nr:M50 family metallopeptidase [Allobranchiibius sp. CTAmp26]MBO1754689.1 M50 family metallopeptidase [Allobranchiibius sp. CTAmp26]
MPRTPDASCPGWQIGQVRGVPVYLGRSWPIIAIFIVVTFGPQVHGVLPELGSGGAYLVAIGYVLLLLLSVLVHEASHALVGQWRGYQVRQIVADLWGGHTSYDTADTTPLSSALVAVAGPLSNGVLAGLGYLALQSTDGGVPHLLVQVFVWTNGFVAIFNLLPGLPLDGGFLVDSLVWRITGSRATGLLVAGWCGRVVAVIVVVAALGRSLLQGVQVDFYTVVWAVLIAGFLWVGATSAIARASASRVISRVTVRQLLTRVTLVPTGTPLSRLRGNGDLVVTDPAGVPWGFATAADRARVPAGIGDSAPVDAVARRQPQGWVAQVDSVDDDCSELITAVQSADPAPEQLLVTLRDGRPVGIIRTAELGQALQAASQAH